MLCKAQVNLPDWPEGSLRDVDPKDEIVQGYLRAGFAVPMIRQLPKPEKKPS